MRHGEIGGRALSSGVLGASRAIEYQSLLFDSELLLRGDDTWTLAAQAAPASNILVIDRTALLEQSVRRQRMWDRIGILRKGGFMAHRSSRRSADETEIRYDEGLVRAGS
jgi:hypothetical protein